MKKVIQGKKFIERLTQSTDFDQFTKIPNMFFNLIGLIPYFDYHGQKVSKIKTSVFWFSFAILFLCLLGEFIYFYKAFGNFKNFLEMTALAPCIGFVILALTKMIIIWQNRENLTVIMLDLRILYPTKLSEQNRYNVKKYLIEMKLIMTNWAALYMILIWIFNLTPYCTMIYDYIYSNTWVKELPYFIWYPFDVYKYVGVYEITYLIQCWAGFTSATAILGADLLFCAIIMLICMQFDILHDKFNEIEFDEIQDDSVNKRANQELQKLIKMHNKLINLSTQLEDIYSPSLLINFIGSSLIICLVGFQATAGVEPSELFKFLLFLISSLVQILMLCWYGNKLIESSLGISSGVYESNWFTADLKYKKSILLIMMRSQKSQYLTAFKFSKVSLNSLNTILSTSYSYFTLLRTIYEPL